MAAPREGRHDHCTIRGRRGLLVPAGEGVRGDVEAARAVLHSEVEAEQLADPLVLRNGGEPLIQQVLEAVVVRPDQKVAPHKYGL